MNNDTTVKYWVVSEIDNCRARLIQLAVDTATMGYNGHHGNSLFFFVLFFFNFRQMAAFILHRMSKTVTAIGFATFG